MSHNARTAKSASKRGPRSRFWAERLNDRRLAGGDAVAGWNDAAEVGVFIPVTQRANRARLRYVGRDRGLLHQSRVASRYRRYAQRGCNAA